MHEDEHQNRVKPITSSVSRRHLIAGTSATVAAGVMGASLARFGVLAQEATPSPADNEGTPPSQEALDQQQGGGDVISQAQPQATTLGPAVPPEVSDNPDDWVLWNGNYRADRSATNSTISADTVDQLTIAWSVPIEGASGFGGITSPVLVVGDRIYYQDNSTNTFAVNRETGEQVWRTDYNSTQAGPNGVAIGYGMVFGGIGVTTEVFALNAETGDEVWKRKLSQNPREGITGPPTVYDSVVYISTTPTYAGGDRGVLYAMDASKGDVLWTWDTNVDNLWGQAAVNSGGGLWYPIAVDDDGNIYFGVGNPAPFPAGNGETRPGGNLYNSSMVSLNPAQGSLRWYYADAPHDLADHDFQNTPVLATIDYDGIPATLAIGSGKTGNVAAVLADSGNLLWKVPVGTHNPYGDGRLLPEGDPVAVLPGAAGGVQVPIAYANETVFVPVNEQSADMNAASFSGLTPYDQATGLLVALDVRTGSQRWSVALPSLPTGSVTIANDLVFVGMLSGVMRAYSTESGEQLWEQEFDAGFNAPPSIAGDTLFVAVGGPKILPRAETGTPVAGADNPGAPATGNQYTPAIHALRLSS